MSPSERFPAMIATRVSRSARISAGSAATAASVGTA